MFRFELLLFDLDDTLLRTADLQDKFRGKQFTGKQSATYNADLSLAVGAVANRPVYSQNDLLDIRKLFPEIKFGIFTRSPRCYTSKLLEHFYPNFDWDTVVTYEDVLNTKPDGEGIVKAMCDTGIEKPRRTVMVGDSKVDILAAYRAGCWAFLDISTWSASRTPSHRWTLERMPDAIIKGPTELVEALLHPGRYLPLMEQWVERNREPPVEAIRRWDKIHFFVNNRSILIRVLGRFFNQRDELQIRRQWHKTTQSIRDHKNAEAFPESWIGALRQVIEKAPSVLNNLPTVVTVIPFRPERTPRLEALLLQLKASHGEAPINGATEISFEPCVLAYKNGARSAHGEHLNKEDRFNNVREHMVVHDPNIVRNRHVIVIDDVVTTGATLAHACDCLIDSGALKVICLALTHSIRLD
jgi:HAD superfamily hydrolase (TIGR01509 family)